MQRVGGPPTHAGPVLASDKIRLVVERLLRTARASAGRSVTVGANAIISAAMQLTQSEIGALVAIEQDTGAYTPLAWVGFPQSFLAAGPVPAALSADVLASPEPLVLTHSPFGEFVPELSHLTSHVVLPLRGRLSIVGVLILGKAQGRPFDSDDLLVAELFGEQAGRLIEVDQLGGGLHSISDAVSALAEASELLSGASGIDSLLEATLDGGLRLTGASRGVVCVFEQASETVNRVFHRGVDGTEIRTLFSVPEIRTVEEASDVVVLRGSDPIDLTIAGFSTLQGNRAVMVLLGTSDSPGPSDTLRSFLTHCSVALSAANLDEELDKSASQLTAIVNGMAKPIILLDAMKRVALLNPRAEQILGISAMFVIGAPVEGVLGNAQIEELLLRSGMVEEEVLIGAPPRSWRVQVTDLSEGAAGRLLVMDDVTAEREAAQRERDFVAMIGHEVRTPLAVLKGFAKLLLAKSKEGEALSEKGIGWIEKIDSRTTQLERLIEDLLQISRIEAREANLRLSDVAVSQLVGAVVSDVLLTHEERDVEIDADDELVWILDEGKLRIALRHLLDNALKYSEAPAPVSLRIVEEEDQLRVEIKDRGVGIVSNELPTVFERFRQIDASATRKHGGTGIGLYLSAQLVRLHGGRIGVDSIWGKGSTFWVTLPRLEVPGEPEAGT